MNELIKIKEENGKQLVSARELHEFLEVATPFKKWIDRMIGYGFEENLDYSTTDIFMKRDNTNLGNKRTEYIITTNMAITICKLTRKNPNAGKLISYLEGVIGNKVELIEQRRHEYQFSKLLETITGFEFKKQYPIDGGRYRLDFYLPNSLIVEYDEKHHTYKRKEDLERIEYCRDWLAENEGYNDSWRCPVIRVKEGEELEGINRIVRHIAGFELFDTQYDYQLQVCDIGNKSIA